MKDEMMNQWKIINKVIIENNNEMKIMSEINNEKQ